LIGIGWQPSYRDLAEVPARVLELYAELKVGQALAATQEPPAQKGGRIGGVDLTASKP
jgi:hypothetical protein